MPVEVSQCVVGDERELAEVGHAAFARGLVSQIKFRGMAAEDVISTRAKRYTKLIAQQYDPSAPVIRLLKAVDTDSGKIMAMAFWTYHPNGYKHEAKKLAAGPGEATNGNPELVEEFDRRTAECRAVNPLRREPHWLLELLCTHPAHERKGAGGHLMDNGVRPADAANEICFVESSKEAYRLYSRYEFRDAGETVSLDMRNFEGGDPDSIATWTVMIRQPVGKQGKEEDTATKEKTVTNGGGRSNRK